MLNVFQWSNHCGPTRISTCKQGEDKDWQLKCLGVKPPFLVKGRVEWESSRSSYAISYLLASQAEPVLLSEQNVRERGISTEILCQKQREVRWFPYSSKQLPESKIPSFPLPWETLLVPSASACVPLQFCTVTKQGKRESFQEHLKTESHRESQLARENACQKCSSSPAVNTLRCFRCITVLQWQNCSESC